MSTHPDPDSEVVPDIPFTAPTTSTTPNPLFPPRTPLTHAHISAALSACLALQTDAVTHHSKRPFAALLLGPVPPAASTSTSTSTPPILLTHFSISHLQHAESSLCHLATLHYSQPFLWTCTLVTTWEPCAMCTGSLYWANVGRVVYAASEDLLREVTGEGNGENMTMGLECRGVLARGQKGVEVVGPVRWGGWEERVAEESRRWWREHGGGG